MKLNQILTINHYLKQIDTSKVNNRTAYFISRNIRLSNVVGEAFESFRKSVLSDEWYNKYIEVNNEDVLKAKELYKLELEAADKELQDYVSKDKDLEFYKISLDDYNAPSEYIEFLYDLIEG